jgi:hypothetical protein
VAREEEGEREGRQEGGEGLKEGGVLVSSCPFQDININPADLVSEGGLSLEMEVEGVDSDRVLCVGAGATEEASSNMELGELVKP